MVLILCDSPSFPIRALGPYRIAHALRQQGVSVEVVDYISRWPWEELLDYISGLGPLAWVGFSSRFGYDSREGNPPKGWITELSRSREQELFEWFGSRGVTRVVGGPSSDIQRPRLVGSVEWIVKGYA